MVSHEGVWSYDKARFSMSGVTLKEIISRHVNCLHACSTDDAILTYI